MSDRWTEFKRTADGVSITLYEETDTGTASVVDETWLTYTELEEMDSGDTIILE